MDIPKHILGQTKTVLEELHGRVLTDEEVRGVAELLYKLAQIEFDQVVRLRNRDCTEQIGPIIK